MSNYSERVFFLITSLQLIRYSFFIARLTLFLAKFILKRFHRINILQIFPRLLERLWRDEYIVHPKPSWWLKYWKSFCWMFLSCFFKVLTFWRLLFSYYVHDNYYYCNQQHVNYYHRNHQHRHQTQSCLTA